MAEVITIRARRQPYVGFGVILGPMIGLSMYVAVHTGKSERP